MLISPNFGDCKFTHNFLIDNKLMILVSIKKNNLVKICDGFSRIDSF